MKITDLKFTWSWFDKFLKRNQFVLRTPTSTIVKPMKELEAAAEAFKIKFGDLTNKSTYIYNF
jgi:hypothetical protein